MELSAWIERELRPVEGTSVAFLYDDMASQSGRSLPVIYEPFDSGQRGHWADRGALFDYVSSTQADNKDVLDFGPGDGWPSLLVAPSVARIVGVDGSRRRVSVCCENATRMGIGNASFVQVPPGEPMPFPDGAFDAVLAASSVEQTPDPQATLRELHRVLKPGGRLRLHYEALEQYRGDREREAWLWPMDDRQCRLLLYYRDPAAEQVWQVGLTLELPAAEARNRLFGAGGRPSYEGLTVAVLETLRPSILDARACRTLQPSGRTWCAWLERAGFQEIGPTHDGASFAGRLFDRLPERERPATLAEIDRLLRPLVEIVVQMAAPLEANPMITATKR